LDTLAGERGQIQELLIARKLNQGFINDGARLRVSAQSERAIDAFHPARFRFRPDLFFLTPSQAFQLEVDSGIRRVDIAQNVPLTTGIVVLAALFVLTGAADDGIYEVAPVADRFQRRFEMRLVRVFFDGFPEYVEFLIEIGLGFDPSIQLGDGGGLLLPLGFFGLEFERLKHRVIRVPLEVLVADFERSLDVAIE